MRQSDPVEPRALVLSVELVTTEAGSSRVVAKGELDLSTAVELEDRLREALDSSDEVVLDLSGVEFIDSRGVSAIIWALRAAEAAGKSFKMSSSLSPQARRLFELVGLMPKLPLDGGAPTE